MDIVAAESTPWGRALRRRSRTTIAPSDRNSTAECALSGAKGFPGDPLTNGRHSDFTRNKKLYDMAMAMAISRLPSPSAKRTNRAATPDRMGWGRLR